MRPSIALVTTVVTLICPSPLMGQAAQRTPRQLLQGTGSLTPDEVAQVLKATLKAMDGQSFRLSVLHGGSGPTIEMTTDSRGRPRRMVSHILEGTVFEEFTGRPALGCDGKLLHDELVMEYDLINGKTGWEAHGYHRKLWNSMMGRSYEVFE